MILPAFAATPANIDSNLQKLAAGVKSTAVGAAPQAKAIAATGKPLLQPRATSPGRFDASGRVLVHVLLDGTATPAQVTTALGALKGSVTATNATYGHGILAAWLPVSQIVHAAAVSGVRSLTMEHAPETHAGSVNSQGAAVLRTTQVNSLGINGTGVTVGVLSDSFNTAQQVTYAPPATTAAQDVASGDLPVVNVLEDYPYGTDEGRAMCQVVHDEAPGANIAFATAFDSEIGFANNIVALRTKAHASVITDDIGYFDEPVFSDGILAQAVNAVATSTTLPGSPAVYVSAAGNDGNNAYRSDYRNISDANVRSCHHGNLKLISDPTSPYYLDPALTAGGWFNWNVNGGIEASTTVGAPGPSTYGYAIFLQWDDLFDQDHGITTNYNFLVFDQDGNYLPYLSSTTDAFSVQQPLQAIGYLALGTTYQIAITASAKKDAKAGPIPAVHHLALYTDLNGASFLQGTYFKPAPLSVPNIIGHPNADGAIAAAAYSYSWRAAKPFVPQLENFTSPGPATIYFNQDYQRLTQPIVRVKPEVAGVDGVVNTFFGSPYYNYPYAFFGTSAAAPSIAGVAALMTQAAGGPKYLDPGFAKLLLEYSTPPRNSTVETTQAFGGNSAGFLNVTAVGQSYFPDYLTVNYFGPSGDSIQQITIDGTAAGLVFDADYFTLTTATGIAPASITLSPATGPTSKITLKFKKGTFTTGTTIGFEISQDVAGSFPGYTQDEYGNGAEAEDLSYGAKVTVQYSAPGNPTQTLAFKKGSPTYNYSPADGFGLIDAPTAVGYVQASAANVPVKPLQPVGGGIH